MMGYALFDSIEFVLDCLKSKEFDPDFDFIIQIYLWVDSIFEILLHSVFGGYHCLCDETLLS